MKQIESSRSLPKHESDLKLSSVTSTWIVSLTMHLLSIEPGTVPAPDENKWETGRLGQGYLAQGMSETVERRLRVLQHM